MTTVCKFEGCRVAAKPNGYCRRHYQIIWRRVKDNGSEELPKRPEYQTCQADSCGKKPRSRTAEYCETHYYRLRRTGSLETSRRKSDDRLCLQCKSPLPPNRSALCSARCTARHRRGCSEEFRDCKNCGSVITPERPANTIFCTKACGTAWRYQNDPEYKASVIASANNQQAIRRRNAVGRYTPAQWRFILSFYGGECLNPDCSTPEAPISRDHVFPIKLGGRNTMDNLQPICTRCNSKKNAKHIDYRYDGGKEMISLWDSLTSDILTT